VADPLNVAQAYFEFPAGFAPAWVSVLGQMASVMTAEQRLACIEQFRAWAEEATDEESRRIFAGFPDVLAVFADSA
jgi:hypothetical protein